MSTLSPTLTVARVALSCTLLLYFHPFGPLNWYRWHAGIHRGDRRGDRALIRHGPGGRILDWHELPGAVVGVRRSGLFQLRHHVFVVPDGDLVADLELVEAFNRGGHVERLVRCARLLDRDLSRRGFDGLYCRGGRLISPEMTLVWATAVAPDKLTSSAPPSVIALHEDPLLEVSDVRPGPRMAKQFRRQRFLHAELCKS